MWRRRTKVLGASLEADFLIKQAENQTELKKYIAISEK